jgi:hypothetical protein
MKAPQSCGLKYQIFKGFYDKNTYNTVASLVCFFNILCCYFEKACIFKKFAKFFI